MVNVSSPGFHVNEKGLLPPGDNQVAWNELGVEAGPTDLSSLQREVESASCVSDV